MDLKKKKRKKNKFAQGPRLGRGCLIANAMHHLFLSLYIRITKTIPEPINQIRGSNSLRVWWSKSRKKKKTTEQNIKNDNNSAAKTITTNPPLRPSQSMDECFWLSPLRILIWIVLSPPYLWISPTSWWIQDLGNWKTLSLLVTTPR